MNTIKKLILFLNFLIVVPIYFTAQGADKEVVSTKKERNHITKGNKLYEEGKYKDALKQYEDALQENPSSVVALYNAGLSEIRIGSNPNDTSETAKKMLETGSRNMQKVANLGSKRPELASKANYNLGNVAFNSEDYGQAVNYYKQSLRLNPDDEAARRNLRIAQLKIRNQDQDQNQDQQDQNQDQEQDQQDQNQEQNQDQNQDQDRQDQDQNQDQNQDQQDQQQQAQMNPQVAEQILNAIENKENQTRARVAGQNAEKSRQRNRNKKNW